MDVEENPSADINDEPAPQQQHDVVFAADGEVESPAESHKSDGSGNRTPVGSPVGLDGEPMDIDADGDAGSDTTSDEELSGLCPQCIYMPGLLHMTHNMIVDVTDKMAWWPQFWKHLKNIEGLFCNEDKMRLVTLRCITGGPYDHAKSDFQKCPPKLYEKRWSVV